MWSFLRPRSASQKPATEGSIQEQLNAFFNALLELVNDHTAKSSFSKQYQAIPPSDFVHQQQKLAPIFVALFSYLLGHKPPDTKHEITQENLQTLVSQQLQLREFEPCIWGAIGEGNLKVVGVLGFGIDTLIGAYQEKMDQVQARRVLDNMIKQLPRAIPAEVYSQISVSTHPSLHLLYLDLVSLPLEELLKNFRFLYKYYIDALVQDQRQDQVSQLLHDIYGYISQSYSQEQTLTFLDTIPTGWLEQERGNLLGRDELLSVLTELQEEKSKVEEAKIRDEALLTSIGDGVIATDTDGALIFINQSARDMLQLSQVDTSQINWYTTTKLVTDKDQPVAPDERPMKIAIAKKQRVTTSDFAFLLPDGTKLPVAITATPFILHDQTAGAILVIKDMTHEKEIDRQKTEFISVASHQLRTPLGSMKMNLEMLDKAYYGELPPEIKAVVAQTLQVNERAIQLVNSLLNISRIETGRVQDHPESVKMVDVIEATLKELTPQAEAKKIRVMLNKPNQEIPQITIDAMRLREVIENILSNAIKYSTENGQVTITLSTDGTHLQLEVADQGIGIPQKEQFKVFSRFFRAENAINLEPNGSGFGLFVVKSYVEGWGGKMWFTSPTLEGERGTTFYIQLPLVITPPATQSMYAQSTTATTETPVAPPAN